MRGGIEGVPSTIGRMARIPEKPTLEGLEERWSAIWEEAGTFRFDRSHARNEIFSIDTPPPTVSGSLHMGSAFGYVQTDSIARYQRMRGIGLHVAEGDRKSTRLNSSHQIISYAVFCLKKKKNRY